MLLTAFALAIVVFFAGLQSAFASLDCTMFSKGTVYLKLPKGWSEAYAVGNETYTPFVESVQFPGWLELGTPAIGGKNPSVKAGARYAVMDFMGAVVASGVIESGTAHVSVKNAGSYIVRVGRGIRLVKVK